MKSLVEQIRNAAEFDERTTQKWIAKYDEYDLPTPFKAMKHQHAQNAWAFEALEIAVDALKCNETFHSLGGIDDCDPCLAKRKIAALIPGGGEDE